LTAHGYIRRNPESLFKENVMGRLVSIAVFLTVFAVVPLAAQATSGHVFGIRYHQVHQGQDQAYAEVYATVIRPVYDVAKERGLIVSYLDLLQNAGTGKTTHVLITEYSSWAAMETANQSFGEISREVLGRPLSEAVAEWAQFRDFLYQEYYTSVVP
jgi:hypothetical protein